MENNFSFMAFAKGNESKEGAVIKHYVGMCPVKIVAVNPTKEELSKIYGHEVTNERNYVTEVEYRPSYVINFIKDIPPFGSWFILARKNEQVDDIVSYLTRAEIPCDTFKRSQITSEEFIEKMNRDTVKVLTVHSAKGLEADNVMVVGVGKWARDPQERRVAYVAATRARKRLIWMKSVKKKPRNQVWE